MTKENLPKPNLSRQYVMSSGLIVLTAVVCYFLTDLIGYRGVALILLLVVSFVAMLFDIFPVLLAASLSAVIWNFFFIPPVLNLHIGTPEDVLMFSMYFVVALINAVLTFKIRQIERKNRDQDEKENTIKLYNTLLNSLSHELRTPISTIIGSVDTIRENKHKLTEANREELLHEIEIASFRLNRQVENLLSMSRLEAGILQPKPDWCDVSELIYRAIQNNPGPDHHLYFKSPDQSVLYHTDQGFLEQILQNIIQNAIQHTPHGTTINISFKPETDGFLISIADNGPGFPATESNKIFNKFYRLPHSATGGTGLGLSIARGFTEALGGDLSLDSSTGGGATFLIRIPAKSSFIESEVHEQS